MGDNESCQKFAENPVFHRRSKHILVKFHSVREHVKHGRIVLQRIFTKFMGSEKVRECGISERKHEADRDEPRRSADCLKAQNFWRGCEKIRSGVPINRGNL